MSRGAANPLARLSLVRWTGWVPPVAAPISPSGWQTLDEMQEYVEKQASRAT